MNKNRVPYINFFLIVKKRIYLNGEKVFYQEANPIGEVNIKYIDSQDVETKGIGILIPSSFDYRGVKATKENQRK
ncbi:hypothetical protein HNR69_001459 [Histophilus somni]|nr:hypothetical protein [Histophilus somni]